MFGNKKLKKENEELKRNIRVLENENSNLIIMLKYPNKVLINLEGGEN